MTDNVESDVKPEQTNERDNYRMTACNSVIMRLLRK